MTRAKSMTQHDGHVLARTGWLTRWLSARTVEEGECLLWNCCGGGGGSGGSVPQASVCGQTTNVRRMVYGMRHGSHDASLYIVPTCGDWRCLTHLVPMTRKEMNAWMGAQGRTSTPAVAARNTRTARSTRAVYSMEQARVVRALAAQGVSLREISRQTGVKLTMVGNIKLGRAWREHMPQASVFGLAALGGIAA